MKVITPIVRRPDLSRQAFRDYYENNHAPLGTRYFPFEKYVRNHVLDSRPSDTGFDCLMECWLDRNRALASLEGRVGDIFAEDEAKFMVSRGIGVDVTETVLAGPPRGVDPRGLRKQVLLLRTAGTDPALLRDRLQGWADAITGGSPGAYSRIVLDEVLPGQEASHFPADAVLTLWCKGAPTAPLDLTPPEGVEIRAALLCDSQETTPEELKAAYGTGQA